jgi:alkylation response protein AidB-like acyl-CoA dehydrogenase
MLCTAHIGGPRGVDTVRPDTPNALRPRHDDFRQSFRAFLAKELVPHLATWDREGIVQREVFESAAANGFLGLVVPERWGGAGVNDFRFNVVLGEEIQRASAMGFGMTLGLHNDICLPYFLKYANDEQKDRWLPGIV